MFRILSLLVVVNLGLVGCGSKEPKSTPPPPSCVEDNCGLCDDDPLNDCEQDCSGDWGGNSELDCAGVCGGTASTDADGQCCTAQERDCAGVCGGTAAVDCNGECGGGAVLDCADVCGGGAVFDCADVCGGESLLGSSGACCVATDMDCAGECGGEAVPDCASVCGGDSTEDTNQVCCSAAEKDCVGECGGVLVFDCADECGGTAVIDCAGECGGVLVFDCADECGGATVVDCADECGGNAVEDCAGTCNGTWVSDCAGVCNGTSVRDAEDICCEAGSVDCANVCNGTSVRDAEDACCEAGSVDCAGVCGGTSVRDAEDTCCEAGSVDCADKCAGLAVVDSCDVCDADSTNDCVPDCNGDLLGGAYKDYCDTCVGGNTELEPCDTDCDGTVSGSALMDDCGVCDEDDSNDNTECYQDCREEWGGTATTDDCGECDGDSSNDNLTCTQDCAGVWRGDSVNDCLGECDGPRLLDACGICDADESNDNTSCALDCAGVVDGPALEDACGLCDDDPSNNCELACDNHGCINGSCVPTGGEIWECDCDSNWVGAVCTECEPGHFGEDCTGVCAGPEGAPCYGNGTCYDGVMGDGTCECSGGWGGVACDQAGPHEIVQITSESNDFSSVFPSVATGINGETYVVWQQCTMADTSCEKLSIMASKYSALGWSEAEEIAKGADGSAHGEKPDVVVDSSGVAHIVWMDSGSVGSLVRPTDSNIIYRTWDGATLGETSVVSVGGVLECADSTCLRVFPPKIALVGDSPAVVFDGDGTVRDYEVYLARLSDGLWDVIQLSDGALDSPENPARGARDPAIVSGLDGDLHVLWRSFESSGYSKVMYRRVGSVVGDTVEVGLTCEPSYILNPSLGVDTEGTVFATWVGDRDCADSNLGKGVFLVDDAGMGGFNSPQDISATAAFEGSYQFSPTLEVRAGDEVAANEARVLVTWVTNADAGGAGTDFDIVAQKFSSEGSVGSLKVVSESNPGMNLSEGTSFSPSVGSNTEGTVTCWQEPEVVSGGDNDIQCARFDW